MQPWLLAIRDRYHIRRWSTRLQHAQNTEKTRTKPCGGDKTNERCRLL